MKDLLRIQIKENCKLAIPNGLQELMADLSREVLRAQPNNIYQFIADYLAALLVARENLSVAAQVCDNICNAQCWPELEDELRDIALSDDDIEKTVEVVREFFEKGKVEESNLLLKLLKKTDIAEDQLTSVLAAVRRAFMAHKRKTDLPCDSSSGSEPDETARAVRHTLRLYKQTLEHGKDCSRAAERIQAAYRAYRVRRHSREQAPAAVNNQEENAEKAIRFNTEMQELFPKIGTGTLNRCTSEASSSSLAGSFIDLPRFTPYCNTYSDILEHELEDVHTTIDYIANIPEYTEAEEVTKHRNRKKSISFHQFDEILYSNCDKETSDRVEQHQHIITPTPNQKEDVKGVRIDKDNKNDEANHENASNNEMINKEDNNKEMVSSDAIDKDVDIMEEITNHDASEEEGDIAEEIPNDVDSTDLIEKVMSTLNHDEFTHNDTRNETNSAVDNNRDVDKSLDDVTIIPNFFNNNDFDSSSKESETY